MRIVKRYIIQLHNYLTYIIQPTLMRRMQAVLYRIQVIVLTKTC